MALFLIGFPYFQRGSQPWLLLPRAEGNELRELRERKASFLLALRELDFDYETGKLSAEDYKDLRDKYQTEAVRILKELEIVEKKWAEFQENLRKDIGSEPEVPAHAFCSRCGSPHTESDRFCGKCGANLRTVDNA